MDGAETEGARSLSLNKGRLVRALWILSFALVLLVLFYRRPDAFLLPQFYAEEGSDYFADAYNQGWISLFNAMNGYFNILPRLVMLLMLSLRIPLAAMPAACLMVTLLCYLALISLIFLRFPGGPWSKFFASLAVFYLPLGDEILMSQTNMQWFSSLFIFLIFFGEAGGSKLRVTVDGLLLFFFALTGPYALILLPLVVWKLFKAKAERSHPLLCAILLVTSLGTVYSILDHGSIDRAEGAFSLTNRNFVRYFFFQYSFFLFGKYVHQFPFWLMLVGALLILAMFVLLFRRSSSMTLAASWLFLLITLIAYRSDPGLLSPFHLSIRNFFLPAVFFLWALIQCFGQRRWFVPVSILMILWFFLETVLFIKPYRLEDKKWSEQVKRAGSRNTIHIPINPTGWEIVLKKARR